MNLKKHRGIEMISYGPTPEEERDKRNEWKWYYAYIPTKVGFDAENRTVTIFKEYYQGRRPIFWVPQERQLPGVTVRTWDLWREECQNK